MVPVVSHSLRLVPMSTFLSISEVCLKLPVLWPGSMTTVLPASGPLAGLLAGSLAGSSAGAELGVAAAASVGEAAGITIRGGRASSAPAPVVTCTRTHPARAVGASTAAATARPERRANHRRSGLTEEADSGDGGLSS